MTAQTQIAVTLRSSDRARITRKFKTVAAARRFATDYVGVNPDMACGYAISDDGVGKVTVSGCTLAALFNAAPKAAAAELVHPEADDQYQPMRTRTIGCTCCDYGLHHVGCECGAEA